MHGCRRLMVLAVVACLAGTALAQPTVTPPPVGSAPVAEPPIGPADTRPVLPERGPRLEPMGGDAAEEAESAKPPKPCHRLSLDDGSLLLGEIVGQPELTLKAKIGDLTIEFADIARIDPAFPDEDKFTVTLDNGDRLTGELILEEVKFKTVLGELPLKRDGLYSLEAGKLFEQSGPVTRRSPDGRSVVTISRKYVRFQPNVENPHTPYSNGPTYSPYPTPRAADELSFPGGVPTTIYVAPSAPSVTPLRPTTEFAPDDGFAPRLVPQ